jgi:glycogen(starch) synthase
MRVLMVSWEYPPVVYGGLGRHVHGLSEALVADGHEVTVLTQAHEDSPADESVHGVRIVRVQAGDDRSVFPRWVRRLNQAQVRAGRALLDSWQPDVLHSPLVATIHATEAELWTAGSRSVRFAGHLAEAELAALLGAADVALVPSSYEPFGMVALEAGAAGTPVVAGAAGGLPEVVANGRRSS